MTCYPPSITVNRKLDRTMGEHEIHVSQKIPGRCHTLATPLTIMRMFKLVSGDLGAPASVCVCVCLTMKRP